MSKLAVGSIGISLDVAADGSHLDDAAEAERLGYAAIWLPGGQIDSLDRIAELVRATTTIPVASGISARDTARGPLRFLSGVRGYRANFERMGFGPDDISELTDRLVDDLVVWGDVAAIAARVGDHLDAGADQVMLSVRAEGGQPGAIEVARQLAATLPVA